MKVTEPANLLRLFTLLGALMASVIFVHPGCSDSGNASGDAQLDSGTDLGCSGDECSASIDGFQCEKESARCGTDGGLEVCVDGAFVKSKCPVDTVCSEGECKATVCKAGETRCSDYENHEICDSDGAGWTKTRCPQGSVCLGTECVAGCIPDTTRCDSANVVFKCNDQGKEEKFQECDTVDGEVCAGGRCWTACQWQDTKRGYLGCRFAAADLPNDESADDHVFAFVFSNPDATRVVTVTITDPVGKKSVVSVDPHGLTKHELPVPRTHIVRDSGISRKGFIIDSSHPIVAFMFNPLEKYDKNAFNKVATNDGSLLLPDAVLGTEYRAMTWSDPGQFSKAPYVTVVALHQDTEITITPTTTIILKQPPMIIPAGKAVKLPLLNAQDVLNLESPGEDLTGTLISSNKPVAAFSGNACARVPNSGRFCDHIETQLPPTNTWGSKFWVTKFTDRGGDPDFFRILARDDNTRLTFDPPRTNVPALDKGQFYEFQSTSSFVVEADRPVIVGQFMASMNMTDPSGPFGKDEPPFTDNFCPDEDVGGGTCWGDPSLVLVPPVGQLRQDYIFLVPDTYRYDFVNIGFPDGVTIELNDQSVDLSTAVTVGQNGFRMLTLPLESGVQRLIATGGTVAVIVYGFDHNISYAYNAGLNFLVLP